jgi:hypothetical protein
MYTTYGIDFLHEQTYFSCLIGGFRKSSDEGPKWTVAVFIVLSLRVGLIASRKTQAVHGWGTVPVLVLFVFE